MVHLSRPGLFRSSPVAAAPGGSAFRLLIGLGLAWMTLLSIATSRAEIQPLRFWEDSTGEFRILARLVGCEGADVILEREDGEELRVLRSRLSDADGKHLDEVLAAVPQLKRDRAPTPEVKQGRRPSARDDVRAVTQSVRLWEDESGQFSVRARMVDFEGGKVILETEEGEEIAVATSSLSPVDRRYVDGILSKRRDLLRDETDAGAAFGEELGLSGRGAFQLLFTILLVAGLLVALWGLIVFFRAAFEEAEYWLLGVFFPPMALVFLYLHWELARPGLIWIMGGLAAMVLALAVLGDEWAVYLPSM